MASAKIVSLSVFDEEVRLLREKKNNLLEEKTKLLEIESKLLDQRASVLFQILPVRTAPFAHTCSPLSTPRVLLCWFIQYTLSSNNCLSMKNLIESTSSHLGIEK